MTVKRSVIFILKSLNTSLRRMRALCLLLAASLIFSGCGAPSDEGRGALAELCRIFSQTEASDYVIYGTEENAGRPLTDAMLERLFCGANLGDLCYVRSMALCVSRRFSDREIFVLELYDPSHRQTVKKMLSHRAEKKKDAVLLENGVYLYLICHADVSISP